MVNFGQINCEVKGPERRIFFFDQTNSVPGSARPLIAKLELIDRFCLTISWDKRCVLV